MRRVQRRKRRPAFVGTDEFAAAIDEFEAFHFLGGTRGKQGRSPLRRLLQPFDDQIAAYLQAEFDGVCAYTEVVTDTDTTLELTWHRPPSNATGLDGSTYSDHYWWLALDYRNWYLASNHVASIKGNSFPVLGRRLDPPKPTDTTTPTLPRRRTQLDNGLLIDPTEDSPSFWLRFNADGTVSARHNVLGEDRGAVTISTLDLSSERLNQSRRRALASIATLGATVHEPFAPPPDLGFFFHFGIIHFFVFLVCKYF